jgi:hypothetical protein
LTDVRRIFFGETRVPPPEGFSQVLQLRLPVKRVFSGIIQTAPVRDISQNIDCKFDVGDTVISALNVLAKRSFAFNSEPIFDPLERVLTPGEGESFRQQLLENAQIIDPLQRHICSRLLQNTILPAHEANGHVEVNLAVGKSSIEFKAIWLQLFNCLMYKRLESFLAFPRKTMKEILLVHYVNPTIHELYALLKEESAWNTILGMTETEPSASRLQQTVRSLQDKTVIGLLKFLKEKTGDDLSRFEKVVDEAIIKYDGSLSNNVPQLLRDLANGIEIDELSDYAMQTMADRKYYTQAQLDWILKFQKENDTFRSPDFKAQFSTFMSLSYDSTTLTISFFSQNYGQKPVDMIPMFVLVREAKRILEDKNIRCPISPFSSMEQMWNPMLEDIAQGRKYQNRRVATNFITDFTDFYVTWRPALLEAFAKISHRSSEEVSVD